MLVSWVNILPLFIVKWLARRFCMRMNVGNLTYAEALPDVLIRV
jgi:hypothetical protein